MAILPPRCVQPRPTTCPFLTMTQPTDGLGQTAPRPRRASASAARIAARSVEAFCGVSVADGRPPSIVIRRDPPDEFAEILGLAEIAVDRGKADIGDLVERRQRLHDQLADHVARDVGFARAFELAHQRIDDALDAVGLDRALAQRDVDRAGQLVAVERLALRVLLDDRQLAQLHSLEAQVREQQVQLHYYQVVAPRAGIVGDVPVRVGDRVLTTTTLTTVDRPGSLEAYIYVPIEKSAQLKMNLPVQIVDGSGNPLATSRITFISPQVDTTTQTVLAKAKIANSKDSLRTAQFIRARVIWGSQEKPVVPVVAVSRIGGLYFAFVAEADQKGGYVVHQKPLQIGQIVGNNYVVLDGVKPGDKVVVSGTQFLIDGVPVVPQESSS